MAERGDPEYRPDDLRLAAYADVAERLAVLYRDAREARAQLDAMVSSAPAILWRWDAANRCTFVSDGWATLLGRPVEEAMGTGWSDSVHPDDHAMFVERCERPMRAGEPFSAEYRLRSADGSYVTVHDQGRPTDDDDDPTSFVGAALDVTQAHVRQMRAERLETLATALAGSRSAAEVADAVLEHALAALDAPHGAVGLPTTDGASLTLTRQRGFDPKRATWRELPLEESSPLTRAFTEGRAMWFDDADDVHASFPHLEGKLMPYRARAALPLLGREGPIGVLYLAYDEPRSFDADTRSFHEAIADLIAGSLERAMLTEERQRAAAETRTLLEVTSALGGAVSMNAVRSVAADAAKRAVAADGCLVGLVDRSGARVDYGDATAYPAELVPLLPTSLDAASSPVADAILDAESLRFGSTEELLARYPLLGDLLDHLPFRSRLFVPIVGSGAPLGVMVASSAIDGWFGPRDQRILESVGRQCGQAFERALLMDAEAKGRLELERALSRLSRLASVTSALSLAVDTDEVATVVLDAACEALGGIGGVVLIEGEGVLRRAAITGIAAESPFGAATTFDVGTDYSLFDAFREGNVVWIPTESEWRLRYPAGAEIFRGRARSAIAIPFVMEDRVLGAMAIYFARERTLARAERRLARTIGEQGAQALERARLYDAERSRSRRAERLQRVSMELAVSATQEQVGEVIVSAGAAAVGAQGGLVAVVDDRDHVRVVAASGIPDAVIQRVADTPVDGSFPGNDAIRARLPSFLRDQAEIRGRYPDLDPTGPDLEEHAWATLPLIVHGRAIGAVHYTYAAPQEFGAEQLSDLAAIVGEAAQAMYRAQEYAREREASLVLQESLLPAASSSSSRRADVVTRYWAGTDHLDVGGDWWDVIELPNGKLAVSIGDVVGRGLHAAAAMGQLRSALRGLALGCRGPAATLEAVDRFAIATPGTEMATVVYAEVDPRTGEFRYACAGHPPPVVLVEGHARVLDEGRSPMLAAGWAGPREEASIRLPAGSVVVLYTDGLVERRGETFDRGIDRLLRALEVAGGHDLDDISEVITRRVLDAGERSDDAAFICLRIGEPGASFTRSLDAEPAELAELRRELAAWMSSNRVGLVDAESVLVATSEAAANAIEHGYRSGASGRVGVEAALVNGELTVTVQDRGTWRVDPPADDRGRGLTLMRGLMDAVDVRRDPDGTQVTMRRAVDNGMAPIAPPR